MNSREAIDNGKVSKAAYCNTFDQHCCVRRERVIHVGSTELGMKTMLNACKTLNVYQNEKGMHFYTHIIAFFFPIKF